MEIRKGRICGIWGLTSYRAWKRGRTLKMTPSFWAWVEQKRSTLFKKWSWKWSWFWRVIFEHVEFTGDRYKFSFSVIWNSLNFSLYYIVLFHICDSLRDHYSWIQKIVRLKKTVKYSSEKCVTSSAERIIGTESWLGFFFLLLLHIPAPPPPPPSLCCYSRFSSGCNSIRQRSDCAFYVSLI